MTQRVPYEIVAAQAEQLYQKVLDSTSAEEMVKYYDAYIDFIKACGWSIQDYDNEQLKGIDTSWEPLTN